MPTGATSTSGALGAFITAIDTGRVLPGSYLLVESIDRLSRNQILKSLNLFTSILDKGIIIVTLSDNKVYTKDNINNLPDLMYSILIMARSHEESSITSSRVGQAWDNKRKRATTDNHKLTHKCPAWLLLNGGGDTFTVIPDRAHLIQRMYQMCLDGHGAASITKQLNMEHIPTWGDGIHQSRKSDGWHISYIKKLLHAPAVYGEYTPGKINDKQRTLLEPIADYYPAIISKTNFFAVQHATAQRTGKGGRPGGHINIFSAILRCSKCNGAVIRLNKGKQSTPLFACDKGRRGASDCAYTPWPVSEVEEIILNKLTELDVSALFSDQETQLKSIRSSMAATQAGISRSQSDLTKLEDFAIKEELSAGLIRRMTSMEAEIEASKAHLAELIDEERREMLQQTNATVAAEQIQALRFDPLMRVKLQSHIRDLVDHIAVNLVRRRIFVSYNIKPDAQEHKVRIIFEGYTIKPGSRAQRNGAWHTMAHMFPAGP